jgi:hypothetical protein
MKRLILFGIITCTALLLTSPCNSAQTETAADILSKTGITGGLIVHLGCGTGELTASLRTNDSTVVHGLDQSESTVIKAREHVASLGLAGAVSISRLYGDTLPFIDNVINLVVVERDTGISHEEIMRGLRPGGTAWFRQEHKVMVFGKPLSSERDEWTHYLYDASNNAVSKDTLVAQPRHMQFRTDLEWSRNHHKLASVSGVVTTQGRMFYVMDSGPGADMTVPARWWIVARDAYNGVSLWPVYGSVLVQKGKVYCVAGRNSYLDGGLFLYALDARTGKVIHHQRMHTQEPEIFNKATIEALKEKYPEEKISQNKVDYRTFVSPDRSDGFSMAGSLNDVVTGDGEHVYLRHLTFEPDWQQAEMRLPHLFSTSSFIDGNENHRSHMAVGLGFFGRTVYAYPWIPQRFGPKLNYPIGLMIAYQGNTAWSIQRGTNYEYTLFQKDIPQYAENDPEYKNDLIRTGGEWAWSVKPTLRPRAMVKTRDKIILGGMPLTVEGDPYATFEGQQGGCLQVFSTADGRHTHTKKLDSPVAWDGMAAAHDKLYITCQDGRLICLH